MKAEKPKVALMTGISGQVMHALMPHVAPIAMSTAFRMFPDSSVAKGGKPGEKQTLSPEAEAVAVQQMVRGINF